MTRKVETQATSCAAIWLPERQMTALRTCWPRDCGVDSPCDSAGDSGGAAGWAMLLLS